MTLWLSCSFCTISVEVDQNGRITEVAPIARRFLGQHIRNLRFWMNHDGSLIEEVLSN
jgi:hypothetical protein